MRALVLATDGYGGHGGIALHCRHLLQTLAASSGIDTIDCVHRLTAAYAALPPNGVRLHYPGSNSTTSYLKLIARMLQQRFDLIVVEHIHLLPFASLIALRNRARLVLIAHGFEAWNKPRRWLPGALRRVDQVVCVSSVTRQRFLDWSRMNPDLTCVIHNALEPEICSPGPGPDYLRSRYGLRDESVLLTVGRLNSNERAKGFDETMVALAELITARPDLRYLIVGDGDDRQRLERLASSLGIAHAVIFAGQIAHSEKADHYRLADVYVMPSRLEGFGYVFLEAMASGLPVIGSTIDGSRDALLDGQLGQLVDPDQPDELVAAIETALLSEKCVPAALSHFSMARFEQEMRAALLGD